MQRRRWLSAAGLLAILACGGDSTSPNGGTNGLASEPLSAVINGVQWGSPVPSASYKNGILAVAGIDLGLTASISFGLGAQGPGTYSLAPQNPNAASAIVTMGGKGWGSAFAGGTGTLTITTLTAHQVTGTFVFTAVPSTSGATGTVTVTNGRVNISF